MALPTNALTTVATLAAELGISTPASSSAAEVDLERRISVASDLIEARCGRKFYKGTVTEKVAGYGEATLRLSRYPLVSITSVTLDGTAVDSDSWSATPEQEDADAGLLRHLDGCWEWTARLQGGASPEPRAGTERRLYTVVYVGGYVLPKDHSGPTPRTLPHPLEQACLLEAVASYRAKGRDTSISSEALLSASVSYRDPGAARNPESGLLLEVEALLKPFMRWS